MDKPIVRCEVQVQALLAGQRAGERGDVLALHGRFTAVTAMYAMPKRSALLEEVTGGTLAEVLTDSRAAGRVCMV